MKPSRVVNQMIQKCVEGWGGLDNRVAAMPVGLRDKLGEYCEKVLSAVNAYSYPDEAKQVAAIRQAIDALKMASTPALLAHSTNTLKAATDMLCESRAPVWLNATKIQIRTDVYNMSPSAIKTLAGADNSGWDARNLMFMVGMSMYTEASQSVDTLRTKRVAEVARSALDSFTNAKLTAASQVVLAKGMDGGVCTPSYTTAGLEVGGRVRRTMSVIRSAASGYTGNEVLGAAFPISDRVTLPSRGATTAGGYVDVFQLDVTIDAIGAGYYGVALLDLTACVALAVAAADGAIGSFSTPAALKRWAVAVVTWNTPDGNEVTHHYSSDLSSENTLNHRIAVNVLGAVTTTVTVKFWLASAADAATTLDLPVTISSPVILRLYPLDPTSVLAQSLTSVSLLSNIRFDDALGQGYMNCGDLSNTLSGTVQAYNEGTYNNALVATTMDGVCNAVGSQSILAKYQALHASMDSYGRIANPAFYPHLRWSNAERVRRVLYNIMSDMSTGYTLLESVPTFSNRFQVNYFGSAYLY